MMLNELSRMLAKFRFKVFRFMSIVFLGRESAQSIIGQCVSTDLEFANTHDVRTKILQRKLLSEPSVQRYDIPNIPSRWQTMYARCAVFPRRYAYILTDVVVGPETGVIHAPPCGFFAGDGIIFVPSVGNPHYLFQKGIQEVMCRWKLLDDTVPICPMPVMSYYHAMFECLLRVVIAFRIFGDIKLLLSKKHPRFIDEMLEFIGVKRDQIIISECPVHVKKGVLIPRWSDSGENLREDVCAFRDFLASKLHGSSKSQKVYISRAKSRRSLPRENEIENVLRYRGFMVVYFEDIPFCDQLELIHGADTIVAPHGAGLANIIAARPGTKIVEIMTEAWANSCYGHLADSLGLDYTCIDAEDPSLVDTIKVKF